MSFCICMRIALFQVSSIAIKIELKFNIGIDLQKIQTFDIIHANAMQSTQPSRQHTNQPANQATNQILKPSLTDFSVFLSSSSVVLVYVCVCVCLCLCALKCGNGICIQYSPHCFCAIFCHWNSCYCCFSRNIELAYSWHTFWLFALAATSIKLKSL